MKSHFAEVNGVRLHYLKEGKGKLMLFLHGFPEYCRMWEEQITAFSSEFTCVAPDLRGFNLSSQPLEVDAYRPNVLHKDIKGLIEHLGFSSCILVAHDWGGATAWGFAMRYPHMVEKLVILNAPHPVTFARELANNQKQRDGSSYFAYLKRDDAEMRLSANHYAKMLGFFDMTTKPFTEDKKNEYRAVWARGLKACLNYYHVTPLQPDKPMVLNPKDFQITVKTLVLWGMNDMALVPELLDGLEDCITSLKIVRYPNATHWLLHEEGSEITREIRKFVS